MRDEQSTSNYFQIITIISTILSFLLDRYQHPFCQLPTSSEDHEASSWDINQQVHLNPERRRANDYVRPTSVWRSQYTALLVHAADQPKSVVYTGYCTVSARIIFHNRRGTARLGDLKRIPSEPCNILYIVNDKSFAKLQGTISKKVCIAHGPRETLCVLHTITEHQRYSLAGVFVDCESERELFQSSSECNMQELTTRLWAACCCTPLYSTHVTFQLAFNAFIIITENNIIENLGPAWAKILQAVAPSHWKENTFYFWIQSAGDSLWMHNVSKRVEWDLDLQWGTREETWSTYFCEIQLITTSHDFTCECVGF